MSLYRHYKNKPYKYLGTAWNSETREEMVIYETRYENAMGSVWVRPKKMFHESVDLGGERVPRFKSIPIDLRTKTEIGNGDLASIASLMKAVFGSWDPDRFAFPGNRKHFLAVASIEGQDVGFKVGYEQSRFEFYSWLGGVRPEYRGLSIASRLMDVQHEWCRTQGYERITTKTQNHFKEMLVLNVRHGFDIVGTQVSQKDGLKILMEKRLIPS